MSQLPPDTIRQLQTYVTAKITERGFDDESLHERLLLLTEEVGELVKACRKHSGMYTNQHESDHRSIGEELTDVLNMTFAVAAALGIDVEEEFHKKEKIIDARTYARKQA